MDLVVLGAYYSKGSGRSGHTGYLMGVPEMKNEDKDDNDDDDDDTVFYTFCKVGSGLSDDIKAAILARTQDKWNPWIPNNVPSHMKQSWNPKGDDIPHLWIHPEDSFIFEVRGSEIVETETFNALWTLRFPRIVKLRNDKTWREATSRSDILSMTDRSNGGFFLSLSPSLPALFTTTYINHIPNIGGMIATVPVEELTIDDVKGKSATSKRQNKTNSQSRSTRRKVGVMDEHKAVDTSCIRLKRNVFRGKEIYIIPSHQKDQVETCHKRKPLTMRVTESGGKVVLNKMQSTEYIVAYSNRHVKVKGIINEGANDVLLYKWLLRCLKEGRMVIPYSEDFIHTTPETERRIRELRDEYGDSYAVNVSESRLRDLLKSMNGKISSKDILSSRQLSEMEGGLRGVLDSPVRIFSGCVFFSICPRVSRSHCALLMERVRLLGGTIMST